MSLPVIGVMARRRLERTVKNRANDLGLEGLVTLQVAVTKSRDVYVACPWFGARISYEHPSLVKKVWTPTENVIDIIPRVEGVLSPDIQPPIIKPDKLVFRLGEREGVTDHAGVVVPWQVWLALSGSMGCTSLQGSVHGSPALTGEMCLRFDAPWVRGFVMGLKDERPSPVNR